MTGDLITLDVRTRRQWRAWLAKHHESSPGIWFVFQNVLPAMASLGPRSGGGVAFFAHIGGFIAGLLLIRPFLRGRSRRDSFQWAGWRPPPRRPVSRSRYEAWRDH